MVRANFLTILADCSGLPGSPSAFLIQRAGRSILAFRSPDILIYAGTLRKVRAIFPSRNSFRWGTAAERHPSQPKLGRVPLPPSRLVTSSHHSNRWGEFYMISSVFRSSSVRPQTFLTRRRSRIPLRAGDEPAARLRRNCMPVRRPVYRKEEDDDHDLAADRRVQQPEPWQADCRPVFQQ